MTQGFQTKTSSGSQEAKHLNRQIPPEAHTPMYNFHKYWSRKTWNVVGKFIESYCPENGIVFDPFAGSGVTAMEALRRGRKAIVCDLNPLATELIRLTIKPVSLTRLQEAFQRAEERVKDKILALYKTRCRKCHAELTFDCAIWKDNQCVDIRYATCPHCEHSRIRKNPLTTHDKKLLKKIESLRIKEWYPKNPLYHISGNPFMKKEKFESLDELFTKRNLYALAILMNAIEKETNKDLKDFLKIGFSSMVHLCTKMVPVRPSRPLSSAWTVHSYWHAPEFMEQNVWYKFESAIIGKQGLLKAKEESNKYYKKVKFARNYRDVLNGKADVFIYTGSCLDLMKEMKKNCDGCVDYIFTDPPYDSSIQYGELSYLWVAWLKKDKGYLAKIDADEIIHNEKQQKDFNTYASLMQNGFNGMFDVLKHGQYLTLTFHNPTFKVRNATIRTGVLSGFELEKIHHQELAHPSPKALLQPFGSAQGDFYLRFHKPSPGRKGFKSEDIDALRFEKIIVETTVKILAERGEPTPYTILINAIDPELAKRGFFSELDTGINAERILKKHLDEEFCLVKGKIGGVTGKLWWFKNPNLVPHLEKIPLSERVEQTVLRQLQAKGKVTFTDMWNSISIAFPNSLTSDQSSIINALEDYARPVKGGFWLIKSNFRPGFVEKEHTTIIAILAEAGLKSGYDIHIGNVEQSHEIETPHLKKSGKLAQYSTYNRTSELKNIQNPDILSDMDILWIKNDTVKYAFKVECTTSMTSALQRGSNLDKDVKKIMLIPADREKQLERKMKSPMFYECFTQDNWGVIYFDILYRHWHKDYAKLLIDDLVNRPVSLKKNYQAHDSNQLNLFSDMEVNYEPAEHA